jgi:hypothetical protein
MSFCAYAAIPDVILRCALFLARLEGWPHAQR